MKLRHNGKLVCGFLRPTLIVAVYFGGRLVLDLFFVDFFYCEHYFKILMEKNQSSVLTLFREMVGSIKHQQKISLHLSPLTYFLLISFPVYIISRICSVKKKSTKNKSSLLDLFFVDFFSCLHYFENLLGLEKLNKK